MTKAEDIYDKEIAPALLAIAKRCQQLGFPFIAQVEWEKRDGQIGYTEFCPDLKGEKRPSASQLLVHYAARSKGNLDAMLMGVEKDVRRYGHSSGYLLRLGIPMEPVKDG